MTQRRQDWDCYAQNSKAAEKGKTLSILVLPQFSRRTVVVVLEIERKEVRCSIVCEAGRTKSKIGPFCLPFA